MCAPPRRGMTDEIFEDERSVLLFSLVHMFQRSALVNMGFIRGHDGETHWNINESKDAIDMLLMLQEKTTNNLDDHETRLLNGVISELQIQFVKAPEIKRQMDEATAESERMEQTFRNPSDSPSEEIVSEEE